MKPKTKALPTSLRPTCPRCGHGMVHHQVVVTGANGHKRQVWICRNCGKTTRTDVTTSTVHGRYQICCGYCGFLCGEKTKATALRTAGYQSERHKETGERVTIHDIMAHRGKPNLWDAQGNILERKE